MDRDYSDLERLIGLLILAGWLALLGWVGRLVRRYLLRKR